MSQFQLPSLKKTQSAVLVDDVTSKRVKQQQKFLRDSGKNVSIDNFQQTINVPQPTIYKTDLSFIATKSARARVRPRTVTAGGSRTTTSGLRTISAGLTRTSKSSHSRSRKSDAQSKTKSIVSSATVSNLLGNVPRKDRYKELISFGSRTMTPATQRSNQNLTRQFKQMQRIELVCITHICFKLQLYNITFVFVNIIYCT